MAEPSTKQMTFKLRAPCKECPFLRGNGYLDPKRAEEIANYGLRDNKTFACHKTAHLDNDQQCAGALIQTVRAGWPNFLHRFAAIGGMFDPDKLDMTADIYETAEEMRDGHDLRKVSQ